MYLLFFSVNAWRLAGPEIGGSIGAWMMDGASLYHLRDAEAVRYGVDVELLDLETAWWRFWFCCRDDCEGADEIESMHDECSVVENALGLC